MAKAKAPSGRPWTRQYLWARARHFRSGRGACDSECVDIFQLAFPLRGPRTDTPLSVRASAICESLAMEGR